MPRDRVSGVDRRVGAPRAPVLWRRRLAVSERRRQADRPVDRAGRGAGGAAASAAPEHDPLDQVDRDRESAGRQPRGTRRGPGGRPLQADQQPALPARLPRVRLPFHAGRRHPARPSGDRRPLPGPVQRRPLARRRRRASAAAGNTWFIPYETIQNREKDRPHPGDLPSAAAGDVPAAARPRPDPNRGRSVPGPRLDGGRVRPARRQLRRHRDGRGLSEGASTRALEQRPDRQRIDPVEPMRSAHVC